MDDLVKRLRSFASGCRGSMWQSRDMTIALCDESADRIEDLQARVAVLEEALRPFSDMAGEMFARNWNRDGVAISFVTPDGPMRLTFNEFLNARTALKETGHD